MGKYMKSCKGIGEVAVMEVGPVGVRTRARALAMAMEMKTSGTTAKRRKVVGDGGGTESKLSPSLEGRIRRENSVSPANSRRRGAVVDLCSSPSSDRAQASCCSSNGSSELSKERSKLVDLEAESVEVETTAYKYECRERRETTLLSEVQAESGELESTAERPSEANSRRGSTTEAAKMPSEFELEEFFAVAEKEIQKKFSDKYNFDIVNGMPLKGRYEWIPVQQKQ